MLIHSNQEIPSFIKLKGAFNLINSPNFDPHNPLFLITGECQLEILPELPKPVSNCQKPMAARQLALI
ncbi:MAG: hypothetical protein EAZ78_23915 [Oscillatoriales cyanobacterium]|nr:MAG: hypothetical protein EA000_21605 [Oscillatoriales cyanobacterium]TAD96018.1 MAG: hypothetical protein EAZ98_13805 [Oscillatoriales cyanobacterium]TAE04709.1 MAG: hypothetical protein EAZ96_08170 [Oscillatoriales cyanobacterium]TAE98539.1 MAG: hypothetical protein EAZ78_23915 [Oscillatoriales cyanobacterium]TAF34186.1 MAG: hypothetical protein EAZ68_19275 [Oscillatoriales cyanobacterium]